MCELPCLQSRIVASEYFSEADVPMSHSALATVNAANLTLIMADLAVSLESWI